MDNLHPPDLPGIASLSIRSIRNGLETGLFKCVHLVVIKLQPSTQTYIARINEVNQRCRAVISIHQSAMDVAWARDLDYELGNARG
ncbi:hypothetical protein RRF57_011741 [Xylaria bambusicola]|uniref:Uncharacterized protein n=1 Tax=Xylaria bambusicola TaxID=326684 RepID=A0AAN7V327_9PEZI